MKCPPFKFIEVTKNRHGAEVVYFRRKKGARIRLPLVTDKAFEAAYLAALNGKPIRHVRDMPDQKEVRKQATERYLKDFIPRAKTRSLRSERAFDLSLDWLLALAEEQDFRCALTRIPFFTPAEASSARNPFWPSVDRIDSSRGYTKDNVRLVVFAVNMMLADWGPGVFETVANAFRYTKTRTSIPAPNGHNSRTC